MNDAMGIQVSAMKNLLVHRVEAKSQTESRSRTVELCFWGMGSLALAPFMNQRA